MLMYVKFNIQQNIYMLKYVIVFSLNIQIDVIYKPIKNILEPNTTTILRLGIKRIIF